jgi:hypothetical protein
LIQTLPDYRYCAMLLSVSRSAPAERLCEAIIEHKIQFFFGKLTCQIPSLLIDILKGIG